MGLTRREFGKLSAAALLAGPFIAHSAPSLASNPTGQKLHGLSAFGDLALPADYKHFSYANPQAPQGGTFSFTPPNWAFNQNPQTFDTLNTFVLKGNAPPRMELCFDALMTRDADDPSAIYGALARSVEISADRNTYTFELRPEARWRDGTPITADDVAFTFTLFKEKGHPDIQLNMRHLAEAKVLSKDRVSLVFDSEQSDRVILTLAVFPIVSKAFYTANDFETTTMEEPLGSGPYKVGRVNPGSFIEYERDRTYWANDLPFAQGLYHFDKIRVEFYRERVAGFEAFKKGDLLWRQEFTSKIWATEYDFPAVQDGKVRQTLFSSETIPTSQGWALNRRRARFADPRTREAIGYAFDFEWTNRNLFYDAYARSASFFEGSDYAATGAPSDAELALLEPLRDQVPSTVFEEATVPPVSDGSGRDRSMLRRANALLQEAGWRRDGRRLVDQNGEPFTIEFLIRSPTFERILGRFVGNLKALGIEATIRLVDPSQYQLRLETFDFDITGIARRYPAIPAREGLEQLFGSEAAARNGTPNIAGIDEPAVDALIAKAQDVSSQEELIVVLRALDRVLRATHSWIPNWHSANHRVAHWDIFGWPEPKPDFDFQPELTWWVEPEKAKALGKG